MPGIDIPAIPADGTKRTVMVPALADASQPTLQELTAPSAIDISCYITAGGWNPTVDQATIADQRQCSTTDLSLPGRKTPSNLQLQGIDNTNHPTYENKLAEAMVEGVDAFLVTRRGLPFTTPWEAGQIVEVVPVTVGVRSSVPEEANSVTRSTWNLFASQEPVFDAVVTDGS
jgi:hypothetical protein